MLLQLTETVTRSLLVNTPSYYQYGEHAFLKIVEDRALYVSRPSQFGGLPEIKVITPEFGGGIYALFVEKGSEISADEFNAAFCEVHNEFSAIQLDQSLKVA